MLNRWLPACLGGWLSACGGIGAASHSGVEVCQWSCGGAPSVPSGSNVSQIPKGSSAPVSDSDSLRRWPCQLVEVSWHSVSPVGIGFGTLFGLATGSHPVQICWPQISDLFCTEAWQLGAILAYAFFDCVTGEACGASSIFDCVTGEVACRIFDCVTRGGGLPEFDCGQSSDWSV